MENCDRRPSLLMFLWDQMPFAAMGCHGHPAIQSPNLDRLAARGIDFREAYTPSAICSPARASLMTGLLPHQHGLVSNATDGHGAPFLDPERPTFARQLQAAGYRTGYVGQGSPGPSDEERARRHPRALRV